MFTPIVGKGCFQVKVNIEADIQGNKLKNLSKSLWIAINSILKGTLISSIESIYEGGMKHAEIENVTKKLGTQVVLDNCSLEIKDGSVFGLIGPKWCW